MNKTIARITSVRATSQDFKTRNEIGLDNTSIVGVRDVNNDDKDKNYSKFTDEVISRKKRPVGHGKESLYDLKASNSDLERYLVGAGGIVKQRLNWKYAWVVGKRLIMNAVFNSGISDPLGIWGFNSKFKHKMILNPLSLLSNGVFHFSTVLPTFTYSEWNEKAKLVFDRLTDSGRITAVNTTSLITMPLDVYYAPFRMFKIDARKGHVLPILKQSIMQANWKYNITNTGKSYVPILDSMVNYNFKDPILETIRTSDKYPALTHKGFKQFDVERFSLHRDTMVMGITAFSKSKENDKIYFDIEENDLSKKFKNKYSDEVIPERKTALGVSSEINKLGYDTKSNLGDSANDYISPESNHLPANAIPFIIHVLNNNKLLILNTAIESYTDNNSASWEDKQAVGKAVPLKSYTGNSRTMNVSLKVFPNSPGELKSIYQKLNYIIGLAYPFYNSDGYPESPVVKLTLGGLFNNTYCIITNTTTTFDMEVPWENRTSHIIGDESFETSILPKSVSINLDIFPIGNSLQHAEGKLIHGLPDSWVGV